MASFFANFKLTSDLNSQLENNEFDQYLNEPQLEMLESNCPFSWWKLHKTHYPTLSNLARKYLTIPATSVPSERLFSDAGYHVTSKRNCLDPETVNQLVTLKRNIKIANIFPSDN